MMESRTSHMTTWIAKYKDLSTLTELEYEAALCEAQILRNNKLVSETELIQMVKFANFLLLRSTN